MAKHLPPLLVAGQFFVASLKLCELCAPWWKLSIRLDYIVDRACAVEAGKESVSAFREKQKEDDIKALEVRYDVLFRGCGAGLGFSGFWSNL